jgi:hypothetical protein
MTIFWVVAPCSPVEVTDVSEVLAASIIRAMSHGLHGATTQKTVIFNLLVASLSVTSTQGYYKFSCEHGNKTWGSIKDGEFLD